MTTNPVEQSEPEEATFVGPWLGYDPRDNDWHCDECEHENPNGPPNCSLCGHPHVLTPEELDQVEQLEKLPDEIFAGALLGEFNGNSVSGIDGHIEYLRQWSRAVVQKIIAHGQGYALVAFQTKTQEAELKEQMIISGFENIEFTMNHSDETSSESASSKEASVKRPRSCDPSEKI